MKRGIIALLSVLAMAFAFAGCGGSDGGSSSAAAEITENGVVENDIDNGTVESVNSKAADVKASIEDNLGPIPAIPGT